MAYAETRDGTEIYYKDWGTGDPVILIHGWPLSADSWDPITDALAHGGHRVIAYDRRGFGRSDQPWTGYDYDTFADDLADIMDATGATENVSLIGFSMGGGEVARYMSRYQGKGVDRVALLSSVVPYLLHADDNPDGVPQATFDRMTQDMLADRPAFMRGFLKTFFGVGFLTGTVSDDVLHMCWNATMQSGLHPTMKAAKAFSSTDFRGDLASFIVPTLIIHGTDDKTVPIDPTARAAASAISGSQLIEYDGSPHGIFETDRERLIRDLMAFLNGEVVMADAPDRGFEEVISMGVM